MTIKISQLSKEHLETARTLLRAAQTMTNSVIAGQLKALAEAYDRRAEEASRAGDAAQLDGELKMQRRHSLDRLLSPWR